MEQSTPRLPRGRAQLVRVLSAAGDVIHVDNVADTLQLDQRLALIVFDETVSVAHDMESFIEDGYFGVYQIHFKAYRATLWGLGPPLVGAPLALPVTDEDARRVVAVGTRVQDDPDRDNEQHDGLPAAPPDRDRCNSQSERHLCGPVPGRREGRVDAERVQ